MADSLARLTAALQGRYAIENELGQGGMATVYLARDLKHGRHVALKVLRPELAAVVGAERFLAEIRTTASLQHPHILPLFDSGEAGGFLFYVMPRVEGETLREKLDRQHQLPVEEAVRLATNVAEALDYAHRHGVIHRDIKPANILLHGGKAVVSDFGIALAIGMAGEGRLTETGLSLGTPHYMSPEQATGDPGVGAPTDTYALGCVLYEMLVGEPPHTGSTPQAVLGKIITEPATRVAKHRASVPANVDAAVRKALEKIPADRFSGADAFTAALADPGFRHGEVGEPARHGGEPWRRRALVGWGAAAVAVAALGYAVLRPVAARGVERFALPLAEPATPLLLPDGSGVLTVQLSPSGQGQLMLRAWNDLAPRPIAGTEGAIGEPGAVSPDGREIAFTAGGELKVASLVGGGVRTAAEGSLGGVRWGADGYIYFSRNLTRNIVRVRPNGGPVEEVIAAEVQRAFAHYEVVPGADVAVFREGAGTGTDSRIIGMRLSTGEQKELARGTKPFVTSTGHLVWLTEQGEVQAAPFDLERIELSGAPVTLVESGSIQPNSEDYSVSESGTLAYLQTGGAGTPYEFVWVSRAGQATPLDAEWRFDPGESAGWSLSPDGSRLAVREMTAEGPGIWIKQLPNGPRSRLTFAEGLHRKPRWSPDGRTVTYLVGLDGDLNVWSKRADGVGEATLLFDFELGLNEGFYTPDGAALIIRVGSGTDEALRDILRIRPGVDAAPIPLVATRAFAEESPALSPDGRWLAYTSNETGRLEVFVRPYPDVDAEKVPVSRSGGFKPVWSRDGRELFFADLDPRALMVAEVRTTPRFEVVGTRALFEIPTDYLVNRLADFYDVTDDGERFLMARRVEALGAVEPQLILVQNWFEELKQRVPN